MTPPATPPKKKARNGNASTPTGVCKILRKFSVKATATASPKREMMSVVFSQEQDDAGEELVDVLVREYMDFVCPSIRKSRQLTSRKLIKTWDASFMLRVTSRCLHLLLLRSSTRVK
jgi:hypothetical protein